MANTRIRTKTYSHAKHIVTGDRSEMRQRKAPPAIIRPELFLIPADTIQASKYDEVHETFHDMLRIGIAHLPYPHCIIGVPGRAAFTLTTPSGVTLPIKDGSLKFPRGTPQHEIDEVLDCIDTFSTFEARFHYLNDELIRITLRKDPKSSWCDLEDFKGKSNTLGTVKLKEDVRKTAGYIKMLLIVLLATRNAIKTRTKDKLLALGIGRNKNRRLNNQKPLYTTTISLPTLRDTDSKGELAGKPKAPHLRRGHVRDQRWGPRRSFVKSIWIEPIFVNADETYVSTRVAYNTSLPPQPEPQPEPEA